MWVFSFAIPHGMHLVVQTHPYFFWVVCYPCRTFPSKEPEQEPYNRFSLFPTAKPYFPYLWPMTHHFLYLLGIGWWCLDLARAPLLCMFKTCLLLMHLPWSGGSSAHSATHPWLLTAWAIFWFPILYSLLPLGPVLCLIVGFSSFRLLIYFFCSLATISCHTTPLFLLWCYLTQVCWASLGLLLLLLSMTQYGHWIHTHAILGFFITLLCGLFCPIYFFLGILGHFSNSAFL